MKVPRVRTEAGQLVTLEFLPEQVEVHETAPGRQRAAKTGVGGLILAAGLAMVAVNAEDRGPGWLGPVLWIACGVVFAGAALGGLAWWLVMAARDRRRGPAATISAPDVSSAQSKTDNGEITVSLQMTDGNDRTFAAVGHSGALLATQFGRLLSATP
ncbi:hypothetical protein AB0J83_49870 [Actinoplanes sp. NPDC049596]|uniref:hypothetical protein n=1 Tax=unclassified Actinoplanes TaxID=2626549 RepID=UPI003448C679